jgi:hypothetical protein
VSHCVCELLEDIRASIVGSVITELSRYLTQSLWLRFYVFDRDVFCLRWVLLGFRCCRASIHASLKQALSSCPLSELEVSRHSLQRGSVSFLVPAHLICRCGRDAACVSVERLYVFNWLPLILVLNSLSIPLSFRLLRLICMPIVTALCASKLLLILMLKAARSLIFFEFLIPISPPLDIVHHPSHKSSRCFQLTWTF